MDEKQFQIVIFGKEGCTKCHSLNKRIDKLLERPQWERFSKHYHDILTEDGLVEFCSTECINPQRIPAMVVKQLDPETGAYEYLLNPSPGETDRICRQSRLHTILGVQTDYSSTGTITPKMISHILTTAIESQR